MSDLSRFNTNALRKEVLQRMKMDEVPPYSLVAELARREEVQHEAVGITTKRRQFLRFCADQYGLTVAQLTGKPKHRAVAWPRLVSMVVARSALTLSGQEAAILFNRSDHSSYFHARDAVQSRLELRQEAIDLEHKWNTRNQKKK